MYAQYVCMTCVGHMYMMKLMCINLNLGHPNAERCVSGQLVLSAKWVIRLHQVRNFRGLCHVFHHHVPRAIIILFFLQVTTAVAAVMVLAAGMNVALRVTNIPLHVHVYTHNTACPVHTTYTECTLL